MAELDLSGRTLGLGQFNLLRRMDSGGFGDVYLADQPELRRHVVVKVLRPEKSEATVPERFQREAQLVSRLNHAYATHVYAFGIEKDGELAGLHWIALELVPGVTLSHRLTTHGRVPLEDLVPFFARVAEVVQAAHDLKIIHRDLKPSNIMVIELRGGLFPKLLDFGIAKIDHKAAFPEDHIPKDYASTQLIRGHRLGEDNTPPVASRYELTPHGAMYGTRGYMAPEQKIDSSKVGPKADIYAAALVFCEALTGRKPIVDEDPDGCLNLHLREAVLPPGDGILPMLDRILRTALSKDPEQRHGTVKELADQLSDVLRASDRARLQSAAQIWKDRGYRRGMLLAGRELKRLTSDTSVQLTELECSFVAASQRRFRHNSWIIRSSPLLAAVVAVAVVLLRAHMAEEAEKERAQLALRATEERAQLAQRTSEQIAIASEMEQGRQALLHGDSSEAVRHLMEAYRRGERSTELTFMLARALQPRMSEQARFTSSSGRMWSALFAPDGKRVVTTDDKSAQMWDAESHQLLCTMRHGNGDVVFQAAFSPDQSMLVTAGGDGTVRVWAPSTCAPVRVLTWDTRQWRYYALAVSSHFVAAIDVMGRMAHVWNVETGARVAALDNDASEVAAIAFSSDERWLATTGGDEVRLFDALTWKRAITIPGPRVRSIAFDPTGPRLAIGTYDGVASVWEVPSGQPARRLRAAGESVDAIAFSRNGMLVATASRDGTEQVWDARSGGLRTEFNAHRNRIFAVEFSSSGDQMLSASADGSVVVSNVQTGMSVTRLEGPTSLVATAHFDQTSQRVVGASWDGTARIWDAASPYRRWSSPPIGPECDTMDSLVPDQRFIAHSCRTHGTTVWDSARGAMVANLPTVTTTGGDYYSALPAVTAAGDRVAIAQKNTVEIYALPSGQILRTVSHSATVNAVAFAPVGHDFISGAVDGSLLLTRDGQEPMPLPSASAAIDAAAVLPDGRVVSVDAHSRLRVIDPSHKVLVMNAAAPYRVRLLRVSPDNTRLIMVPVRSKPVAPTLLDLTSYRPVTQLDGHEGRVFAARFVRDGHAILTAGADGTVRLWSATDGSLQQTYRGDSRLIADATLTPDGAIVVGGSSDGLLRFWDASSGRLLWTLPAHKSHVIGLHYEGNELVSRGFAGDVARWALPQSREIIDACDRASCAADERKGKQL